MARAVPRKKKPTKNSEKPVATKQEVDPAYRENLERLAAFNTLMSPFWSARSGYLGSERNK